MKNYYLITNKISPTLLISFKKAPPLEPVLRSLSCCLAPALPKPPLKFFGNEGRAPQKPQNTKNSLTRE